MRKEVVFKYFPSWSQGVLMSTQNAELDGGTLLEQTFRRSIAVEVPITRDYDVTSQAAIPIVASNGFFIPQTRLPSLIIGLIIGGILKKKCNI